VNLREPGTVLDGKYEIIQRLGSGGMGEVYLVRHVHLQELRVVKILRQDLAADSSAQARFIREARLATQIKHPNVAILYDFDRLPDGSFYMVSEHIEGENVGDRLRHSGPISVSISLQLAIQALRGLGAIHAAGIVHRDLSPDNLMMTTDKSGLLRLKIIDLGLARTLETDAALEITQTGTFMGKLQYCSPEQASMPHGATLDHRSDLYSFGLVLYEMLVGLPPFDSESGAGFIFKRLSEDPLPLRSRNPGIQVPQELERVVRRALERNRDERYPDAVSFLVALESVLRGLDAVETKEVPVYRGAAPAPAAAPVVQPPRQRSSSELSKADKLDLLAQIERAGRKTAESSREMMAAESALAGGRLDEARSRIARLEAAQPQAMGLARLKERLQQAEGLLGVEGLRAPAVSPSPRPTAPAPPPARPVAAPAPRPASGAIPRTVPEVPLPTPSPPRVLPVSAPAVAERVADAEKMFQRYLEKRQLPLARLALDTLFDLAPAHPRREELLRSLSGLGAEDEASRRAESAAAAAREALARDDLPAARQQLQTVEASEPRREKVAALRAEVETAERGQRLAAEIEAKRRQFEALVAEQKVVEARRLLDSLAQLGVPRVTLGFLEGKLSEVRGAHQLEEQVGVLEQRYRRAVDDRDWFAAREIALDRERLQPGHPRASAMFSEVERLEADDRKRQSVVQGVQQVEQFLAEKDVGRAELALKILLQMDPENRHRKRLEKAVREMRK
jgi:serine/threonine-protein kinase